MLLENQVSTACARVEELTEEPRARQSGMARVFTVGSAGDVVALRPGSGRGIRACRHLSGGTGSAAAGSPFEAP